MATIAASTITRSLFQEPDSYNCFSQLLPNTDLCRPSLVRVQSDNVTKCSKYFHTYSGSLLNPTGKNSARARIRLFRLPGSRSLVSA